MDEVILHGGIMNFRRRRDKTCFIKKGLDMKIEHMTKNDTMEIKPYGNIYYYEAEELSEFIRQNSKGIRKMFMNLEEVFYCSSAGIRTLMEAEIDMSKLDGLVLYNVNDSLMKVFKLTGLDSIFNIMND